MSRTPKNAKDFGALFVKTETMRVSFFAFLHLPSALLRRLDLKSGNLPRDFFAAAFRTLDIFFF
jgi:hypothetical protein